MVKIKMIKLMQCLNFQKDIQVIQISNILVVIKIQFRSMYKHIYIIIHIYKYIYYRSSIGVTDFEFVKFISKGAFDRVWLVRKKITGDHYAMKIIEI